MRPCRLASVTHAFSRFQGRKEEQNLDLQITALREAGCAKRGASDGSPRFGILSADFHAEHVLEFARLIIRYEFSFVEFDLGGGAQDCSCAITEIIQLLRNGRFHVLRRSPRL